MRKLKIIISHLLMSITSLIVGYITFEAVIWYLDLSPLNIIRAVIGGIMAGCLLLSLLVLLFFLLTDVYYHLRRGVYR